jgi:H+/gluconate symporter-like permease
MSAATYSKGTSSTSTSTALIAGAIIKARMSATATTPPTTAATTAAADYHLFSITAMRERLTTPCLTSLDSVLPSWYLALPSLPVEFHS